MIFRGLSESGDWEFGQGLSSYATGEQAIALDAQTRLMMFFNDYFYSLTFGINWFQFLSSKNPQAQNGILVQTRQMLVGTVGGYASYGIVAINAMDVFLDPITRALTVEYDVATIFSSSLSGSVSLPLSTGN